MAWILVEICYRSVLVLISPKNLRCNHYSHRSGFECLIKLASPAGSAWAQCLGIPFIRHLNWFYELISRKEDVLSIQWPVVEIVVPPQKELKLYQVQRTSRLGDDFEATRWVHVTRSSLNLYLAFRVFQVSILLSKTTEGYSGSFVQHSHVHAFNSTQKVYCTADNNNGFNMSQYGRIREKQLSSIFVSIVQGEHCSINTYRT